MFNDASQTFKMLARGESKLKSFKNYQFNKFYEL